MNSELQTTSSGTASAILTSVQGYGTIVQLQPTVKKVIEVAPESILVAKEVLKVGAIATTAAPVVDALIGFLEGKNSVNDVAGAVSTAFISYESIKALITTGSALSRVHPAAGIVVTALGVTLAWVYADPDQPLTDAIGKLKFFQAHPSQDSSTTGKFVELGGIEELGIEVNDEFYLQYSSEELFQYATEGVGPSKEEIASRLASFQEKALITIEDCPLDALGEALLSLGNAEDVSNLYTAEGIKKTLEVVTDSETMSVESKKALIQLLNTLKTGVASVANDVKDVFAPLFNRIVKAFTTSESKASPIILDLDGDGIETTHVGTKYVNFDLDNNGFAERTGWVNSDDGLLVLDRNKNGAIDNGSELFGDHTKLKTASMRKMVTKRWRNTIRTATEQSLPKTPSTTNSRFGVITTRTARPMREN